MNNFRKKNIKSDHEHRLLAYLKFDKNVHHCGPVPHSIKESVPEISVL